MSGSPFWFGQIEGKPSLGLGVLFVCNDDITAGRNRIWRLRKTLITEDSTAAAILSGGRTGVITNC